MESLPVIALAGVLVVQTLLRAHHAAPRAAWEERLPSVVTTLSALVAVIFLLRVLEMVSG